MIFQSRGIASRRVATCKPGKPGLTSFSETPALFFHPMSFISRFQQYCEINILWDVFLTQQMQANHILLIALQEKHINSILHLWNDNKNHTISYLCCNKRVYCASTELEEKVIKLCVHFRFFNSC